MAKRKIFIICPIRPPKMSFLKNVSLIFDLLIGLKDQWEQNQNAIKEYVTKLETDGYEIYWPKRDNPHQETDKTGTIICKYNLNKMLWADEIHIWYDENSIGSIFDIGMFFMFVHAIGFKKFVIINRKEIAPTPHKSFKNVILDLAEAFNSPTANGIRDRWNKYGK